MQVSITQLPSRDLAFTNYAYFNPSDPILNSSNGDSTVILSFNGKSSMFRVDFNKDISPGTVALNKYQRDSISAGLGTQVNVNFYKFNPLTDKIHTLEVTIESLQSIQLRQRITIKEDEIISYLKAQFKNKPFNRGTDIAFDYQNFPFKLSVVGVKTMLFEKSNDEYDFRNTPHGFLVDTSILKLSAPTTESNRFLTIVKQEEQKQLFNSEWNFEQLGIGGLDKEAGIIFRRAFASRLLPPEIVKQHKIKHVKGMLLYGPPGTGKTLIAREIGTILGGKKPRVVNGPELLDKYVGQAEANIRALFEEAIADYNEKKEAADLHVIIFDEIDSICKKRGTVRSGTGVHDTVVNQLLTMIDGVDSPNNILVIGMTNRKDLLDPALLRPGRLEVHVEISLPDEAGRAQILRIHTQSLRENNTLAKDVDLKALAKKTSNYSGGELEGVVTAATSYAIANAIDIKNSKPHLNKDISLTVTMDHFERALLDVIPAFGVDEGTLTTLIGNIVPYPRYLEEYNNMKNALRAHVHSVSTLLIHGESGTGTTAMAACLARDLGAPFIKILANYQLIGLSEIDKIGRLGEVFEEAYKSPDSILIIDDVERLIEYTDIGPRFSNSILQSLLSLLTRPHPHPERRLTVILTTKKYSALSDLDIPESVSFETELLPLQPDEIDFVAESIGINLHDKNHFKPEFIIQYFSNINIKRLLTILLAGKKISSELNIQVNTEILEQIIKASNKRKPLRHF